MKNITLSVDDEVLEAVKAYAAQRKTTVNALVRAEFERLAKIESRTDRARRRIQELGQSSQGEMGSVIWKREDLYER